jgi:hypothetical protein
LAKRASSTRPISVLVDPSGPRAVTMPVREICTLEESFGTLMPGTTV